MSSSGQILQEQATRAEDPTADPARAERETRGKSAWWRTVLGEYPTGVTAITSVGSDGEPVGMVVGTFTAVSEHPPLIGFLPAANSRTFAEIRRTGTFCANVLGYEHEELCRRFSARTEDRFDDEHWETTELGNRRLVDAVAWFEGTISEVTEVGDHFFVVAEVADLGVGDGSAGLPLLFLKGRYGSFTVPSLTFDVPGLSGQLRAVESVRGVLQQLADDTGTECLLSTVADDSVLVLAAANLLQIRPRHGIVGMNFPFAAPLAPVLAAWNTPEAVKVWEEGSRHLLGAVDRPLLGRLLASVKEQGYAITVAGNADGFDDTANDPEASRGALSTAWGAVAENVERALDGSVPGPAGRAAALTALQFPVFDAEGRAQFELVVSGFHPHPEADVFDSLVTQGKSVARTLTGLVGGVVPSDYR